MKKFLFMFLAAIWFSSVPVMAQRTANGSITASGTSCTTSGACVQLAIDSNTGAIGVAVSGTYVGTLQFEGVVDGGIWANVPGDPLPTGGAVSSTTSTGTWLFNVAGLLSFRVRASAYTSGTAAVSIRSSTAIAKRFSSVSGGNATFTTISSTGLTAGSTLFAGAGGLLSQNNSRLFWDNTNFKLNVGAIQSGLPNQSTSLYTEMNRSAQFSSSVSSFNPLINTPAGQRTAAAYAVDVNINNNDTDAAATSNPEDQQIGVAIVSGGLAKSLTALNVTSTLATNRWLFGGSLANWDTVGLRIIQDAAAPAVTGPHIQLVPAANNTNTMIDGRNAADSATIWQINNDGSAVLGGDRVPGASYDTLAQLIVTGQTNPNNRIVFGYDTTNNFGWIQPATTGTAWRDISINPGGGNVGIRNTTPMTTLDVTGTTTSQVFIATTSSSPASGAACTAGTIYWDADYIYICTATGVVKRAALTGGY